MERSNQEKPYKYNNVSPVTSDEESDFENDSVARHPRISSEGAHHDQDLLEEEEEREKLLTGTSKAKSLEGLFNKRRREDPFHGTKVKEKLRSNRRSSNRRNHRRGKSKDEDGELMFEMEEGGPRSETSSQASQSSSDLDKMNLADASSSKVSLLSIMINGRSSD